MLYLCIMVLTDKEYKLCLLDFISEWKRRPILSFYDEDKHRIEIKGNCIKIIFKSSNAVYRVIFIDEYSFKKNYVHYLRRKKLKELISKINE